MDKERLMTGKLRYLLPKRIEQLEQECMLVSFTETKELRMQKFPFSKLGDRKVNTIIFPNLSSGNIAYKMMQEIGESQVTGPILLGLGKPIHILQMESDVREIVDMAAFAVVDAQFRG